MAMEYMDLDRLQERLVNAGVFPLNERTVWGAWMPSRLNGRLVESAFLYTAPDISGKIKRPFAWLTVDSQTGGLVRFAYCAVWDFMNSGAYPLNLKLTPVPVPRKQRAAAGRDFLAYYKKCRAWFFAPADTLTAEQISDLKALKGAMDAALRAELMDFYCVLGAEFFEWLEGVRKYVEEKEQ